MSEWTRSPIGEVLLTSSGGTPKRTNMEFYNGDIPWIKTGELDKKFIYDSEEYITDEAIKNSSAKLFPKNTVLLAMYGATIGNISILATEAATNQACCALLPNNKIYHEYLYYKLMFDKKKIVSLGVGGAQPNISQKIINKYIIDYPSFKEQQKIASILSSVDEAIEKTEQIIKQTEKITMETMKKLLMSGIDYTDFKSTRIGKLPSEWDVVSLKNLARINMGQSPPSVDVNNYEKGLPFYQGNADFGEISPIPQKWCDRPKKIANANDILFSVRAPVGEMNIANEESCIGRGLASIKPNEVSHSFLYYLLLFYRKDLKRVAQGSTFTAINKDDLMNLELPLPTKKDQEKITMILNTMWEKKKTELNKLNKLMVLKKGLMQQLLTGKVRVPMSENEEVPQ